MNPHRTHPFSVILDDKSKQRQNKMKRNKTKARATQGGQENRPWNRNKSMCKYMTNLEIVLIFKDPLISGSD